MYRDQYILIMQFLRVFLNRAPQPYFWDILCLHPYTNLTMMLYVWLWRLLLELLFDSWRRLGRGYMFRNIVAKARSKFESHSSVSFMIIRTFG